MIYVDDMRMQAKVGRINGRWSHLFTDEVDQTELHEFAESIGLRRSWFQSYPDRPWHNHYDVVDSIRTRAILAGAKEVSFGQSSVQVMKCARNRFQALQRAARGES